MTPTSLPRVYPDLAMHIAMHLHGLEIVPDPLAPQDGDMGVFINGWVDQPDKAVMVTSPWEQADRDSDTVPEVRFMVAHRTVDQPALWDLQREVFHALHRPGERFTLTAGVDLLICERVVSDPPVPDLNTRWVAVDTYRCRPYRNNH